MKLSIAFVVGLVCAAGAQATNSFTVPLERRGLNLDIDNLNFRTTVTHVQKSIQKYVFALQNYKRNTGKDHPLALKAHDKRWDTTIDLSPVSGNVEWIGPIEIGGQKVLVDFDTGSADLLVNPDVYNPKKSNTSVATHKQFKASFADNTHGTGYVYKDTVKLGNAAVHDVSVGRTEEQIVNPAKEDGNGGIAGLSFNSISTIGWNSTFLHALQKSKAIPSNIFQFTLKEGKGSQLHFGGVDKSQIDGDITYVDVNPRLGFWLTEAKIKGKIINGIIDSGTTLVIGPMDEVKTVFNRIDGIETTLHHGSLYAAYDCDRDLNISFKIGGKDIRLSKELQKFGSTDDGRCILSIVGQPSVPFHAWVLGDTIFRGNSFIFDADNNRFGFASAAK